MTAGADTSGRSAHSQSREELNLAFKMLELGSIFLPPLSAVYGFFLVCSYSLAVMRGGGPWWGAGKILVLSSLLPQHDRWMSTAASITGAVCKDANPACLHSALCCFHSRDGSSCPPCWNSLRLPRFKILKERKHRDLLCILYHYSCLPLR